MATMTDGDWDALISATATAYTGLVFTHAAWHKLCDFGSFIGFVANYQIVPACVAPAIARVIVAAEVCVTLALIVPGQRDIGAYLAIAILLAYSGAMTANIVRGRKRVECGCGSAPQFLNWSLVLRNIVLSGIAALVLRTHAYGLSAGEVVIAMACGFTLWTVFVLIEQILGNASRAQVSREDRDS